MIRRRGDAGRGRASAPGRGIAGADRRRRGRRRGVPLAAGRPRLGADAAHDRAVRYAESATRAICTFPDSEIKRALLWAPEFVVAREK